MKFENLKRLVLESIDESTNCLTMAAGITLTALYMYNTSRIVQYS